MVISFQYDFSAKNLSVLTINSCLNIYNGVELMVKERELGYF